ncbi:protein-glutamate methylesterase/protein-glutamine glutaminase [Mangrovitalea sediminis]|uniref:protein-glutamate methylesterase/protein-glutamine glutaminase n=1 Tax=Mangrovitalea sediminis TaxID=1982043 RepID=UPI0018E94F6E|nr:chemotaxis response regulator protein-glutamate methylesterase [Mangrovitalea sediminis]
MSIKVLVVDDSALIRQLLEQIVRSAPDMVFVGAAKDAYVARDMVNQFSPDVITLDIEMPRMDGLTFLNKLMRARPTPVVMISTLTEKGSEATMKALELGAVDFIPKPRLGITEGMAAYAETILDKIRAAAASHTALLRRPAMPRQKSGSVQQITGITGTEKLIGIGASTGGTEAIKQVLQDLPANMPAVLITQHMPAGFTRSFAGRLNSLSAMTVKEAEHGERILPGHAYLAPGDRHLKLTRSGANYEVCLSDGEPVNRHKPAVDVMFDSLAELAAGNSVGVLLTGMGKDGAAGMLHLKEQGAVTVAQNEQSCLVYGMPRAAVELGAATEVLPLENIAAYLVELMRRMGSGHRI